MEIQTYLSGVIFTKAYRVIRTHVAVCLEQYNLTPTSWSLLGIVKQAGEGISFADVAEKLAVKAPLVTVLARNLVERQLLQRISNPSDKRAKLLVLTSRGERFIETVDQQLQRELQYLLRGVSPDDLLAYRRVLETITNNGTAK